MAGVYEGMLSFVDAQAATFISSKTAAVAQAMEPAAVTCMSIYILWYGIAHVRGQVQEPVLGFLVKMVKMVLIYSLGVGMLNYNAYVVDTLMQSPETLAAALSGSTNGATIGTLDRILESSFQTGKQFYEAAGFFNGNIGSYIAAFVCWGAGLVVTAYACFLIILSKIFLSVLIALGPLFITALFFETTSKFFESWVAQCANYALTVVLVVAVNVFTIQMFESAATQAAALGTGIKINDVFPLVVTAVVSLLVLAQVPQVASGLAGGIAMSTYGMGRAAAGMATSPARAAGRGVSKATGKLASKGANAAAKTISRKAVQAYRSRRNNISAAA